MPRKPRVEEAGLHHIEILDKIKFRDFFQKELQNDT